MYFSSTLLLASAFFTSTFASNHHHNKRAAELHNHGAALQLQRRAGSVVTTGATGDVHVRLEINDLAQNRPDQWSLFVRTMTQWKKAAQDDTTGYYGISKIHGVPRESWDGVEACDSCGGADGYCPHDSILFPAWHRAYMALYEQEMLNIAQQVASTFSGAFGDRMKAAAGRLRIPYWDWAAKGEGDVLPVYLSGQQVTIAGPNGDETVGNPLFNYEFANNSGLYYSPFTTWTATERYPNSNNADATPQEAKAVSAFNSIQGNMQDQVYQLLTQCDDYLHFGTDDAGSSSANCPNSIEGIHNTIHTTSGGAASNGVSGGHMTYLPLASYDPIFWIHHANVDRIFCMWQTIHDSYGASQVAPHATWTVASGSTQDANSPLKPFRKDQTNFWTTNDVKDWANTFKYTYPEFASSDGSKSAIVAYVNALYGPNANTTASGISKNVPRDAGASAAAQSSSSSVSARDRSVSISASSGFPAASTVASSPAVKVTSSSASSASSSIAQVSSSSSFPAAVGTSSSGSPGLSISSSASWTTTSFPGASSSAGADSKSSSDDGFGIGVGVGPIHVSIGIGGSGSDSETPSYGLPSASASAPKAWNGTATQAWPAPTGTGSSGQTAVDPAFIAPNGSYYSYQCTVKTPRYAFNGSYNIYVFDGQPAANNTGDWLADKSCIGTIGVLAGGDMSNMDLLIGGSIPITRHLQDQVKAGSLKDMSETNVIPYMTKNLNWKIVYDGQEVHPNLLSGFTSGFYSGSYTPALGGELPVWSSLIPHIDVTKGKAGGLTQIVNGVASAINSILPLPTGYGSGSSASGSAAAPTGYGSPAESGSAAAPTGYGSPATTAAPSGTPTASPEEPETTTTVFVTEYETVCPCTTSTAPASPAGYQ